MLKSLLKTNMSKQLEALCKQLYNELTTQITNNNATEAYGYNKKFLITLNKQLERATSKINSLHRGNDDVYKVTMPSCGVISKTSSSKTKKKSIEFLLSKIVISIGQWVESVVYLIAKKKSFQKELHFWSLAH